MSTEDLTRLYRFALLLTGDGGAAQQVLYDACAECAGRLAGYRNEEGRLACLVGTLRQRAKTVQPSAATPEGRGITRAFATLPEEERAALAGIYTGLLPARTLADALKMSLEELGRALKSARERLARGDMALDEPTLEQAL